MAGQIKERLAPGRRGGRAKPMKSYIAMGFGDGSLWRFSVGLPSGEVAKGADIGVTVHCFLPPRAASLPFRCGGDGSAG